MSRNDQSVKFHTVPFTNTDTNLTRSITQTNRVFGEKEEGTGQKRVSLEIWGAKYVGIVRIVPDSTSKCCRPLDEESAVIRKQRCTKKERGYDILLVHFLSSRSVSSEILVRDAMML